MRSFFEKHHALQAPHPRDGPRPIHDRDAACTTRSIAAVS
jgi:hypothetical protein